MLRTFGLRCPGSRNCSSNLKFHNECTALEFYRKSCSKYNILQFNDLNNHGISPTTKRILCKRRLLSHLKGYQCSTESTDNSLQSNIKDCISSDEFLECDTQSQLQKILQPSKLMNQRITFSSDYITIRKISTNWFGKNTALFSPSLQSVLKQGDIREFCTAQQKEGQKKDKNSSAPLTANQMLKNAIKDYGIAIVIFHVTLSLISLGCCYMAVVSGIIQSGMFQSWGISDGAGTVEVASAFIIAYAIHKAMAPWRIGLTLTTAPFVVKKLKKKLRKMGYLKETPKPKG